MTKEGESGLLFETPVDRLLEGVPNATKPILRRLLEEPLRDPAELLSAVQAYLATLEETNLTAEFIDIESARKVAGRCVELLRDLDSIGGDSAHLLVQVAALYFLEEEDAESDISSLIGFDDDMAVLEAVLRELRLENSV